MVFIQSNYSVAAINTPTNVFVFPSATLKSTISAEAANLLVRHWPSEVKVNVQCFLSLLIFLGYIPPFASLWKYIKNDE